MVQYESMYTVYVNGRYMGVYMIQYESMYTKYNTMVYEHFICITSTSDHLNQSLWYQIKQVDF